MCDSPGAAARRQHEAHQTGKCKGCFATVNSTTYGPLCDYTGGLPGHAIVAVQEHHATVDTLDRVQPRLRDVCHHG
eukprot:8188997-Pyramimonas_sp.AAC.1